MIISRFSQKSVLFLVVAISVSLLSGYFCFAPPTTQASNMQMTTDMTDCQGMDQIEHNMISSAKSGLIPLCCLKQKDNSQSGALTLNNLTPEETVQQNIFADFIDANDFSGYSISNEFSEPPPPADLLASVIKIE